MLSKNIETDGNKCSHKNWGDIQPITRFQKNSQEEARVMTDKEQNKQNEVLLIFVRVKNPAFYDLTARHCFQGKLYVLYLIFFHLLCDQNYSLPMSALSTTCFLFMQWLRTI